MAADGTAPGGGLRGAAAAALAGAGCALLHGALGARLAALFWPKAATALLLVAVLAFGAGAIARALVRPPGAARLGAVPGAAWAALWVAGAAGAWFATGAVARGLLPGRDVGPFSFPAWYLALLATPFAVAGAALAASATAGARRAAGGFVAGAGAGLLLLAGIAAAAPLDPDGRFEFSGPSGGPFTLGIDRGLREDVVAPARVPRLAVPVGRRGSGPLEVLMVGFPNGAVLGNLLARPAARITVVEDDARLVEAVTRRWPALAEARERGRVTVAGGNPRLALARATGPYDLVVLAESWSYGALLARAVNFRPDHRWTVEAFREYLARVRPEGFLLVQRGGMGRVVATLREAAGGPADVFAGRLRVLGRPGTFVSELWYRPAGIQERRIERALGKHLRRTRARVLYAPNAVVPESFYFPLVTGHRPRGLAFSTPLDLAPATDARPFFDHHERLRLTPAASALPEELDPFEVGWVLRVIPSGDRSVWAVLLAACVLAAAGIAAVLRRGAAAGTRAALPSCLFLGCAAGLGHAAFAAWAAWLAPSAPLANAAVGAALLAFGLAWLAGAGRPAGAGTLAAAAAAAALLGAAGWRAAPAAFALGDLPLAAAVALAGVLLGGLAGRSFSAAAAELGDRLPGAQAWVGAVAVLAACLALIAAPLAAVTFGHPLLATLAAVAALAAARRRRLLPPPAAT